MRVASLPDPSFAVACMRLASLTDPLFIRACRTFEVQHEYFGELRTVELEPGGSNTPVTADNRARYVQLYTQVWKHQRWLRMLAVAGPLAVAGAAVIRRTVADKHTMWHLGLLSGLHFHRSCVDRLWYSSSCTFERVLCVGAHMSTTTSLCAYMSGVANAKCNAAAPRQLDAQVPPSDTPTTTTAHQHCQLYVCTVGAREECGGAVWAICSWLPSSMWRPSAVTLQVSCRALSYTLHIPLAYTLHATMTHACTLQYCLK